MDGSTDKAKVENELIVLLYCSKDDEAEEMNTCARYFTVLEPAKADGDGLVQCLGKALQSMGIEDLPQISKIIISPLRRIWSSVQSEPNPLVALFGKIEILP